MKTKKINQVNQLKPTILLRLTGVFFIVSMLCSCAPKQEKDCVFLSELNEDELWQLIDERVDPQ